MAKPNVSEIMAELKQDKDAQNAAMKKEVEAQYASKKIKFENLDQSLITLIMTKQSGQSGSGMKPGPGAPTPLPQSEQESDSIDALYQKVWDDLTVKNNVYLWGKAGTGKTVLAKAVATKLMSNKVRPEYEDANGTRIPAPPFFIINCSQWTSPSHIIGGFNIGGYTAGQLELAWTYGGVLILDELPKLDPNTAGLFNDALAQVNDDMPVLTNGKGIQIPKHPDFYVIAAGNTNLKTMNSNFTGNNRQDYSLVDRFSGSIYQVGYNTPLELRLTYTAIYNIAIALRETQVLQAPDSPEAITIRTMLNWNRTFETQFRRKVDSPLMRYPIGVSKEEAQKPGYELQNVGKTIQDAIDSFINELGKVRADNIKAQVRIREVKGTKKLGYEEYMSKILEEQELFSEEHMRINGYDLKGRKEDGTMVPKDWLISLK